MEFRFIRDAEKARGLGRYLNPLPRSVRRANDYALLDGEWQFARDEDDRGLHEHWYRGHTYTQSAQWPGSIEDHLAQHDQRQDRSQDQLNGASWRDNVVMWYERAFEVPVEWTRESFSMVQLTFGACGYETRVWLNGHALKTIEGEEAHFGGYTSFTYELPADYLHPAENRITVRVAATMDAETPRGKQESRVYQRGGIWYQTISGAVRSVWIEPIERNRLRSRLSVISYLEDGLVEFNLTTRIHDAGAYTLRLAAGPRGEQPVATSEFQLSLEEGERRQWVAMRIPDARCWSPTEPHLYYLIAQLTGPDGNTAQIEGHFGLRQLGKRGHMMSLNGEPIYLDGILYQPGAATYEQMRRHMRAMKALGCNLVRVHIAGIDPRIYDLADELGMLLWVEAPSPHVSSQRSRENHWAELGRLLTAIGSHPSIIICSLYNEDWGAQDIAASAETRAYIARAYDYIRLNFPHLWVVDNDGWNHVSVEGKLKSDLLTVHLYTPDLAAWRARLDRLVAGEHQAVAVEPLVVGDPFFYRGQMPLIVSEWGGFGFSEYGGPEEPETKARRIRAFKRELRERPISGDVYTQAISIEDEVNGVINPISGALEVAEDLFRSTQAERPKDRVGAPAHPGASAPEDESA